MVFFVELVDRNLKCTLQAESESGFFEHLLDVRVYSYRVGNRDEPLDVADRFQKQFLQNSSVIYFTSLSRSF